MHLHTRYLEYSVKSHSQILDITKDVQKIINEEEFDEGNVLLFSLGSTSGLTTIEYEPGLVDADFPQLLDHLAPYGKPYKHNETWGDDNGGAHLRSSLIGCSLVVPFENGQLILGTWQQLIFINFDTRPRERKVA